MRLAAAVSDGDPNAREGAEAAFDLFMAEMGLGATDETTRRQIADELEQAVPLPRGARRTAAGVTASHLPIPPISFPPREIRAILLFLADVTEGNPPGINKGDANALWTLATNRLVEAAGVGSPSPAYSAMALLRLENRNRPWRTPADPKSAPPAPPPGRIPPPPEASSLGGAR